ncbi:MAG TPA: glycosidase [Archaeoglobaceae archaeon]|nr:glycosidase [Archaeoglobaceae archaeon]
MFKPMCKVSRGAEYRENRTEDIVKRLGVITADRVHLKKYPLANPVTIFNPSLVLENGVVILYGRVTVGYYTYASAVAEIKIPFEEIHNSLTLGKYTGEIKVFPDNKFDLYGVEDPRVYEIEGMRLMTYCGRTVDYFNPAIRTERTLPVTAIHSNGKWKKICVLRMPPEVREFVVSDKNAFLMKINSTLKLFHRLHMRDEKFYAVISDVPETLLNATELTDVSVNNTVLALEPAEFEQKIGWGTPPVKIGDEYLFFLHGLHRTSMHYKVFALLMNEELRITAITPHYIMAPKEIYETYGDRPFVVFPCGSQLIDDSILISYGAADFAMGIGEIDVSELLSILDSNRIE